MKVASHQPSLLPWVGYWNKVQKVDRFIFMGGVDYNARGFQNRVMVQGAWLSLPVVKASAYGAIANVQLVSSNSLRIASTRLRQTVMGKKYKYGYRLEGVAHYLSHTPSTSLCDILVTLHRLIAPLLCIANEDLVDVTPPSQFTKTGRLVELVHRHAQYPVYYVGKGAAENYLEKRELPFPVWKQEVREGVSPDSIVQLIASEPDPGDYVATAATWTEL